MKCAMLLMLTMLCQSKGFSKTSTCNVITVQKYTINIRIDTTEWIPSLGNTPFGIDCRWLEIHPPCQGPIEVGGLPTTWVETQPPLMKRKL